MAKAARTVDDLIHYPISDTRGSSSHLAPELPALPMVRLQEILDCGPALIEGLISRLLAEGGKFKLLNGSWPPVVRNMNDAKTQDFMRRLADPPLRRPVSVSRPTSSAHAPA